MKSFIKKAVFSILGVVVFVGAVDSIFVIRDRQVANNMSEALIAINNMYSAGEKAAFQNEKQNFLNQNPIFKTSGIANEQQLSEVTGSKSLISVFNKYSITQPGVVLGYPLIDLANRSEPRKELSETTKKILEDEDRKVLMERFYIKNDNPYLTANNNIRSFSVGFTDALRTYINKKDVKGYKGDESLYDVMENLNANEVTNVFAIMLENFMKEQKAISEEQRMEAYAKFINKYEVPLSLLMS